MAQKRVLIHIGKCGGSSFSSALSASAVQFDKRVHIRQPHIGDKRSYFILTRAPIARALSAFNWRHHLVLNAKKQPKRFPGEKAILSHYGTLNALAEALYQPNGHSNALVQGQFRAIHHLGESISFYLSDLLDSISSEQIEGVVSQESLSEDAQRLLGIEIGRAKKIHGDNTPAEMLELSDQAKINLNRVLADDFRCMRKLQDWGHLSQAAIDALDKETVTA